MTIKEIKMKTNTDLIKSLMTTCVSYKNSKEYTKNAEKICKELESRNVINNSSELYSEWLKCYEW